MGWLGRGRGKRSRDADQEEPGEQPAEPRVRASPGVAALFEGVKEDGNHTVLDFGTASETHLRLYGRYARQIRFAGLVPTLAHGEPFARALEAMPPNRAQPYDLVLAWDVLDRLLVEERPLLIDRLAELTAPGARLYALVRTSSEITTRPMRFTLMGIDRVAEEVVGPPELAGRGLLPAEVERVLDPFRILHAFTLRSGMREYVAVKKRGA